MNESPGRYCPPFTPMAPLLPPQQRGDWRIEHETMDRERVQFYRTMAMFSGHSSEVYDLIPGTYAQLRHGSTTVMSDTPMERRTNLEVVERARGDVLIAGLGLGMILLPLFAKPEVRSITVYEPAVEVGGMVLPMLWEQPGSEKLLSIRFAPIEALLESKLARSAAPPFRCQYDTIYFDIWSDICGDNWEQQKLFRRRSRCFLRPGGWQGSWRERECQQLAHPRTGRGYW